MMNNAQATTMDNHKKSRKRRRQDTYSLPRKRIKIDAYSRMRRQNNKTTKKLDTTNVIVPSNKNTISSNGKNKCKKSNGSSHCTKRHQRPMIRLLKVQQSKNIGKSTTTTLNYSPFKDIIAQGRVTHILRSCHAKAFATTNNKDTNSTIDDSLYGIGDESLYFPSCTFGNGFESKELERRTDNNDYDVRPTIVSPTTEMEEGEGNNDIHEGNTTNDELVKINKDGDLTSQQQQVHEGDNEKNDVQQIPRNDAANNSPPMGSFEDSDEWHDAHDQDVDRQNAPRDITNDMSTPRSTNSCCASTQTDLEELPGLTLISEHDSNCSGLPFHFMPGGPPSNGSSSYTPRSFSPINSRNVIRAGTNNNICMFTNEYSPIRPRASKGPLMAPYPSSIRIPRQSMPPPVYHDPATMLPPPFNFMSNDYSTQQCNSSDSDNNIYLEPNTSRIESSRGSLASLVKCILRFAAEWLLSLLMARARYNNDTPNAPQSTPAVSSSPRNSVSNTRQTEPEAKSPQPRLCRKERTYSPRASISHQTQSRPSSAIRANNIEPLTTQREQPSTTSKCVKNDRHQVKISKSIQPPTGWKNLFQPKEGEWKCKTCFYINPSEAMTCDSCTAIKNRPANETLKSCLREKTNLHSTNNNVSDTGKTPSKARKEKESNFNDESSIGNAEEEEESDQLELSSVDSFSSVYESNSEEESESSEDAADEEASEHSADDEEDHDDDDDDDTADEDCSPNKRVKRVEEPLNINEPSTAPPPTVRKPKPTRQSSYELVSDLSHNDQSATTSTSSKRIKRDCSTQEIDIARRTSDTMSEEDIPQSKKRNIDSDDIDLDDDDLNQVNKMAREQQSEAMDDVSVQYSEMDVEGRLTRRTSDTMSEDFPDSRGFHTFTKYSFPE